MENPSPPEEPPKKSRRWFLKTMIGVGGLAAVGKGIDWLLPLTICRPGEWNGPVTDHFDGQFFYNPEETPQNYGVGAAARWFRASMERREYPEVEENRFTPQLAPCVEGKDWEVTMINHSTLLIRAGGLNILTDPVWSNYPSPIPGFGPRRKRPAGLSMDALPKIHLCLISHDHYDHFDAASLKRLEESHHPLFIVPLGLKSLLQYHVGGHPRVEEKDWWEEVSVSPNVTITLTPARHWSKRYRTEETANRSLWCGFTIKAAHGPSLYYAGDTARTKWFAEISKRLGPPDVAILPIGAYKPDWIRTNHTSPGDAVEAFRTIGAKQAIACHFGTWQMAQEGYQETLDDLAAALQAAGVDPAFFIAPENGQTIRSQSSSSPSSS